MWIFDLTATCMALLELRYFELARYLQKQYQACCNLYDTIALLALNFYPRVEMGIDPFLGIEWTQVFDGYDCPILIEYWQTDICA